MSSGRLTTRLTAGHPLALDEVASQVEVTVEVEVAGVGQA